MPSVNLARIVVLPGLAWFSLSVLALGVAAGPAAADEPEKGAPTKPAGPPPGAHPPAGAGAPPSFHPGPGGAPAGPGGVPPHPGPAGFNPGGAPHPGAFHAAPGGNAHYEFHDRDFHHFNADEARIWGGGSWHQDWHDGRYGWWWYTNGGWYFYDQPVYPMPLVVSDIYVGEPVEVAPEAVAAPPAPPPPQGLAPPQFWYYCDNPAGYYPYVQSCPTQFREVPAGQ
jgi:hypothetical protein